MTSHGGNPPTTETLILRALASASGYLVLYGSECHHATSAEEAAVVLKGAGGQLASVVRLDRLGDARV